MSSMRLAVPLLLIAAFGAGETTPEQAKPIGRELTVRLDAAVPSPERHLGYGAPRSFVLETTVPRFLFEVPEFAAKDPVFFRISLGETKGIPFYGALDRSPATNQYDLLYLDKDRDLDLTNDGGPITGNPRQVWQNRGQMVEFVGLHLRLPYTEEGKDLTQPYACLLYHVAKPGEEPRTIQVERDGWRDGAVTVGDSSYRILLVDDNSDGIFTLSDSWTLVPDAEKAKISIIDEDLMRSLRFLSWTSDQKSTVEVTSVDMAGRTIQLQVSDAQESEQQYFERIARKSQSPEERQLQIDPLRPKASSTQRVDWILGKGVDYAVEIAARKTVNKRVLLDFTARDCVWCARMNKYTFRDREVVEICRQFVCAKIQFKQGAGDSRKFQVEGTPTYVILDTDGSEIARQTGFARPRDFAAWLRSALR